MPKSKPADYSADPRHIAQLLRVLRDRYPDGRFDEIDVARDAPYDDEMLRALGSVLGSPLRMRYRWGSKYLLERDERAVARWFKAIDGWPFEGLKISRYFNGWVNVVEASVLHVRNIRDGGFLRFDMSTASEQVFPQVMGSA